ncbi:radical SAM protein [Nocardia sp. CDC159]|uniref:Radical SAM protein n=1 Tax=Nocardia pulmonis TaxID=2951408 RepID=A0A9X2E8C1_9NOCA|nr:MULTISPECIES: radical SAM protein [Nocardia]MCM6775609.1 radical SAM protein [Nocardia pulmonis]MCM6787657.1 radical SAM protein [Nocardia sp. CDC159]
MLFVNPDVRDKSIIYGNRMLNPVPVNLAYRAALTAPAHEVTVIDENATPITDFAAFEHIDLVAVTSKFFGERRTAELVHGFAGLGTPVIVDGYFPSYDPQAERIGAAAVVRGEVEGVWPRILDDAEQGRLRPAYQGGPVDLASLPLYGREHLPPHDYVFPVEATRGCPFSCNFCIETRYHHEVFRTRPIERVIDQIARRTSDFVQFADINIVGNPRYAQQLFRELEPLGVLWGSQATITLAGRPALVEAAGRAGAMLVFLGLESVRPDNLIASDKAWSRPTDYATLIARLHDAGIGVIGSFVFGFPGDTPDVFERTLEFVVDNEIEICHFNPLGSGPGVPLHEEHRREGRVIDPGPRGPSHFTASVAPVHMSVTQLVDGLEYLYTQTYSRAVTHQRLRRYLSSAPLPGPRSAAKKQAVMGLNLAYRQAVERHWGARAVLP